ncbi:MAG: hypothetical protein ABSG77_10205 [Candidatus Acidiferrum sp.]
MTAEHQFQLIIAIVTVVLATLVSAWALVNQLRQTRPSLEVLISPVLSRTVDGELVLKDDWYGVVVRNVSPFPLRICDIGYRVGKKYYSFGKPVIRENSEFKPVSWPYEIEPRARAAFHLDYSGQDGKAFTDVISKPESESGKLLWEISRAYAMTECNRTFISPRMPRKTLQMIRQAAKMREVSGDPSSQF